jgi:hypothetical protein
LLIIVNRIIVNFLVEKMRLNVAIFECQTKLNTKSTSNKHLG